VFDGNDGVARRLQALLCDLAPSFNEQKGIFAPIDRDNRPLATQPKNNEKTPQIYFLGPSQKHNQALFEQMFGIVRK
jgi:hypothetical protein